MIPEEIIFSLQGCGKRESIVDLRSEKSPGHSRLMEASFHGEEASSQIMDLENQDSGVYKKL
jgi:hypothetical protein